ncbi:hypothetical protein DSM14862_03832 (plasmid) [Sulfitobacter indolifex]|uniref:HEPN domain-containing protein n=1 Tax=Sulfitobacter indolifex HEL-45 TaxID=391624 RepID=A0ABM9X0H8_9RHOB|nr:hypothetical protein [Sulfitobacter indolifex]EDQ02976.1 hypothetical protein OIHEL45_19596 [Sulfitobacter indolifex HEL-45]UOA20993.1 hypothetical protein DSM14862_03832 [Sulfitobacter indolifex]
MAAKTSTTRTRATEPLNRLIRLDRLEFRKALDLYFEALRADWIYHETRQKFGTEAAADKGHTAASAWSACTVSLLVLRDMRTVDRDLRAAVEVLLKTRPGEMPSSGDLMRCGTEMLVLANKYKRSSSDLSPLLDEAFCLIEAYHGNQALMSVQRSA